MTKNATSLEDAQVIAVIADIHSNSWALRAVLEDARLQGARALLNLGDVLHGAMDPAGTAELLAPWLHMTVNGNHDRGILEDGDLDPLSRFSADKLSPANRAWLRALPMVAWPTPQIAAFHGTPDSDLVYLLETPAPGPKPRPAVEIARDLQQVSRARLIFCGHSHTARDIALPDGRRVVNPGSVGLPAYRAAKPVAHVVAAGTPDARYVMLRRSGGTLAIEPRIVAYDWRAAAAAATANGFPNWAQWLSGTV